MRCYAAGFVLLCGLISGCGSHVVAVQDSDIEPHASASPEKWQAIKSNVHEVDSVYGKPENFGVVLQQVHTKMCIGGLLSDGNMELLTNSLKFKAFAMGATGITQLDVHIVPWKGDRPTGHRCMKGYMEGTATALILNKERFPYLYPEYRNGPVEKRPN